MKSLFKAAVAAAIAFAPLPALAQDGFEWIYTKDVQQDVFQTYLNLSLAVPETDNVWASAQCHIGNRGPYVSFQLSADVGGQRNGDPNVVRLVTDIGQLGYQGFATGIDAEFGVSGVELSLDPQDALFNAMTNGRAIEYRVENTAPIFMPMRGIGEKAQQFARDCAQIADLSAAKPQAPTRPGNNPGRGGIDPDTQASIDLCEVSQAMRSIDGSPRRQVTFVNDSGEYRSLLWINQQGGILDFAGLNPGETQVVNTFVNHVWEISDGPGNCVQVFTIGERTDVISLKAPARFFGNE